MLDKALPDFMQFFFVTRAMQFDDIVKTYIAEHPHASVVNLGAGFDTTFYRVDNGSIRWYDLDLPEVLNIRSQLLPPADRIRYIAKSFFDPSWPDDIDAESVFMIAGGLLRFFEETQLRQCFSLVADHFPGGELVLDAEAEGSYDPHWSNGRQQDALQAAFMESFKFGWQLFPQSLKDNVLGALTVPTTPRSTEWADVESWFNRLSDEEKDVALHNFRTANDPHWTIDDVNVLETWDSRITVLDYFPMFRHIPRDPSLSASIRQFMDVNDASGRLKIVRMRVDAI